MKNEYIIINKTNIQKRIEELKNTETASWEYQLGQIKELKQILSQSTPLIPEIEKAWKSGEEYGVCDWADFMGEPAPINKQDYISILLHNLKLDI